MSINVLRFLLIILYVGVNICSTEKLIELFKWKQIEYDLDTTTGSSNKNSPCSQFHDHHHFGSKWINSHHNSKSPCSSKIKNKKTFKRDKSLDTLSENDAVVFPGPIDRDVLHTHHNQNRDRKNHKRPSQQNTNVDYIPYNNVPMGVTHFKGRLFITMPRRRVGIPATLNYISLPAATQSPKLKPYPNLEMNHLRPDRRPSAESIISVYRLRVDECERIWFVDTGMLEYPDNRTQVQQPSIWVIDLNTDRVIRRFEIPSNIVSDGRGLASLAVEVIDNCNNVYAYIPDLYSRALYVYSYEQNRMWAFRHNYFSFDPLWGDLRIAGQEFQWDDGIFSITLGNRRPDGSRIAYFHPMVSISEFQVSTTVLRNETNSQRSYHGTDFKLVGNRGAFTQSTMHDYDPKSHVILFAEIAQYGIGCWNTKNPLLPETHTILVTNENAMIYPSDLSIDSEGTVWMMTNSMPLFIYSNLDPSQYNFRVWKQSVEKLIENTICDRRVPVRN